MQSIKCFSVHKTALTFSVLMAVSSLPLIILMAVMTSFMPMTDANGNEIDGQFPMGIMLLVMPIMYLIMGYIFTAIGAWFYNFVAKYTGGIKFELVNEENS